MTTKNTFDDEKTRLNLETQINYLVEDSIKYIITKNDFENHNKLFVTKIRYFVPSFDIAFIQTKNSIETLVFEDFEFDSSEEITADLYIRKKPVNFKDEKKLNINLKENGFIKDVREELKKQYNINQNDFSYEDFEKIIGDKFLIWIKDKNNVEKLIKNKWDKYHTSFKKFEINDLVDQLIPMLKHVYIRRIRSKEITDYVQSNYKFYNQFFDSDLRKNKKKLDETDNNIIELKNIIDIKSQIAATINWFENESENFYSNFRKLPNIDKDFFKGWGTNQKIILIDILPDYCKADAGEGCHGSTIKIGSFNDLNSEFSRIQGYRLFNNSKLNIKKLLAENPNEYSNLMKKLRNSFFEALLGRKYLIQGRDVLEETYKQTLKKININSDEQEKLSIMNEECGEKFVKSLIYKIMYQTARDKNRQLYAAFMMHNK